MENNLFQLCNLDNLNTSDTFVWQLMTQVSTRLQVFSTSAKTGVTSLMDHNIIFDPSTQYAILEEIHTSIDQIAKFGIIFSLLSRIEAETLRVNTAFQSLQELFISLNRSLEKENLSKYVRINYFEEDLFTYLDSEYFIIACKLFFEAVIEVDHDVSVQVGILEGENKLYSIIIYDLPGTVTSIIKEMIDTGNKPVYKNKFSPLIVLNLYTFCRLLQMINVNLLVSDGAISLSITNKQNWVNR